MADIPNPQALQEATRLLFASVAPERESEFNAIWTDYSAEFHILEDDGPHGLLVMEAGLYRYVRFNHRTMRLFWLASFLLWEGYVAFHHYGETKSTDLARFVEILECFDATMVAANVDEVAWPNWIPGPGELVDHENGNPARVAGELAVFSIGWAFLHEIRHLIHQNEGTSAPAGDRAACRLEELSCNRFATAFLLERLPEYAEQTNQDLAIGQSKRQTGIYCALFAITLIQRGSWRESDTHPSVQARVDNALATMREHELSIESAAIASSAFITLQLLYPDAPSPLDGIGIEADLSAWAPNNLKL